jgi:hypothetical protein
VIGSVYGSLYTGRLSAHLPAALPASLRDLAGQSVGAAYAVAQHLATGGQGRLGQLVHGAASSSFIHAIAVACAIAGAVAAVGAGAAAAALPAQPPAPSFSDVPPEVLPRQEEPVIVGGVA